MFWSLALLILSFPALRDQISKSDLLCSSVDLWGCLRMGDVLHQFSCVFRALRGDALDNLFVL